MMNNPQLNVWAMHSRFCSYIDSSCDNVSSNPTKAMVDASKNCQRLLAAPAANKMMTGNALRIGNMR